MRWLAIILLWSVGCRAPFDPPEVGLSQSIVVDGLITDELKQHVVSVYQSSPLNDTVPIPFTGADLVLVESGRQIAMFEDEPGHYLTPEFSGRVGVSYQLLININGRNYASESVTLRPTPPIDSLKTVIGERGPDGVRGLEILLNTSSSNQESFFRWEWAETYEVWSPFPRRFEWSGTELVEFDPIEVRTCWQSSKSSSILIESTARLTEGRIVDLPIHFVEEGSPQLLERYSIEVKQYALDVQGFNFWQTLRELSENQGSIFDVQPGIVEGNISAVDGNRMLLGYFDAAQVRAQRIFLDRVMMTQLGLVRNREFATLCADNLVVIPPPQITDYFRQFGATMNLVGFLNGAGLAGSKECTDCRFQGTDVKPPFWP
ncbi:MAG: DUF4249 domain-containing protein [Bacteroidota bacterium]